MRPGEIFADYRVIRVLGVGGMGAVYLAQHPRLPRQDALKVLPAELCGDEEFRARFLREAEFASRVVHPNIVAVYDRGVFDGSLWIAMQYVPGFDAAQLVRRGPRELPAERAVYIVGEAARGLDAAHAAGLLHRDVKPANILLAPHPGRPDRVLIADFGIARAATESTVLTAAGDVLATVAYAAPEQLEGGKIDHRVDVYALGATLYHLLTGSQPFPRPVPAAVIFAHMHDPPPRPTSVDPALSPLFDQVVARAMAKDPQQRYQSCGALAEDAYAALRGEPLPSGPMRPDTRRRRVVIVGAALLALAMALTAVVLAARPVDGPNDPPEVTTSAAPTTTPTPDVYETWGSMAYIVAAFPRLLPRTPLARGYGGTLCIPESDTSRQSVQFIYCSGDSDPVVEFAVMCNTDRSLMVNAPLLLDATETGQERWTRGSETGQAKWGAGADSPTGTRSVLQIQFSHPDRNFCLLLAYSYTVEPREFYESWWPGVPL
ncbi:serine/threonine-protein kinase [Nocardia sp. NPDC050406]|uniref:serine/threonine-protein kinase n=1 Tax=Nocardia sp. NPDC050406 TaxID=3364318 RepID=UPI0037A7839D